jgi:hypothetical protein
VLTAVEAAEDTDDTALLAACVTTEPSADPTVPWEESPVPGGPGGVPESTAADAGRAKATERIRMSTNAPARPLQAYRHSRIAPDPVLGRPTFEGRA